MDFKAKIGATLLALAVTIAAAAPAHAQSMEAESGTLIGGASRYLDPDASGGQGVAYISSLNSGFHLENVPESAGVRIRYASERSGHLSVFLNGTIAGVVDFPSTGAWVGSYRFVFVPIAIPAGADFEIIFLSGDTAMNVDRLDFLPPKPMTLAPEPQFGIGPDPTPPAPVFGIDAKGNLFHVDEGWSAGFHYLCVEGTCFPGSRTDGIFYRDASSEVALGQTVRVEFKVEDDGEQCLTGEVLLTRKRGLTAVNSPCATSAAETGAAPSAPPATPATAPETEDETVVASPAPTTPNGNPVADAGRSSEPGAGLISVAGDTITTRFAERFRDRHESDRNHDTFIDEYAQGSAYEIILIDRPGALEVQIHSPQAPLSMVNFTHDHIVNPGFVDPPQYRSGGFMAKGRLDGSADDNPNYLAERLFFEIRESNGRPWSEVRQNREIVTLEFTPRRELNGNFPQYYSDIFRYRAGQGGITFERDDDRYFSGGPTTNFAHGSPGFEFSQPYLGIDQPGLHEFTLGRELFRASFLGEPLPGNGGNATGADPNAAASACVDCHFQLGKAAPPGRASEAQQGFVLHENDLRVAPPLIGLGLLEAVDRRTIEALARQSGGKIPDGRFGWKAAEPTIRDHILKALALDLGVRNVSEAFVDRIEQYVRGVGVPLRRHPAAQASQQPNVGLRFPDASTITDPDVLDGEAAFLEAGCANCHVPALQTGDDHPIPQFRNITIRPFTDLLLWNMGPDLCAASGEGNADRCEWRTAPLWGLRLQQRVTGHMTFLHDGRATTLDEAIRLHGGDAAEARNAYSGLSNSRRLNLLLYLMTL